MSCGVIPLGYPDGDVDNHHEKEDHHESEHSYDAHDDTNITGAAGRWGGGGGGGGV